MPRIIDGDNLLGTWPGRRRSDSDRRELARSIGRWAHRERRRVILVFDGPDPPVPPPVHDVHFSGPGKSADDWIIDYLRRLPTAGGWVLVSGGLYNGAANSSTEHSYAAIQVDGTLASFGGATGSQTIAAAGGVPFFHHAALQYVDASLEAHVVVLGGTAVSDPATPIADVYIY